MSNSLFGCRDRILPAATTQGERGPGVMAVKAYSYSPKHRSWSLTIRLFNVISRILVVEVLLLYRDVIGVFYSPTKLYPKWLTHSEWNVKSILDICISLSLYLYIYIYSRSQTDCFVVSKLFKTLPTITNKRSKSREQLIHAFLKGIISITRTEQNRLGLSILLSVPVTVTPFPYPTLLTTETFKTMMHSKWKVKLKGESETCCSLDHLWYISDINSTFLYRWDESPSSPVDLTHRLIRKFTIPQTWISTETRNDQVTQVFNRPAIRN